MRDILIIICIGFLVLAGIDYYVDGQLDLQGLPGRLNFDAWEPPEFMTGPGKFGQALGQAFGFVPKAGGAR